MTERTKDLLAAVFTVAVLAAFILAPAWLWLNRPAPDVSKWDRYDGTGRSGICEVTVRGEICGWTCTQRPGHDGPHIARNDGDRRGNLCAVWPNGDGSDA